MAKEPKIPTSVKLDPALVERMDTLAESTGWSRSELLTHCIEFGVNEGEKFADRVQGPILGHLLRIVFHLDTSDPEQVQEFDVLWKSIRNRAKLSGKEATK